MNTFYMVGKMVSVEKDVVANGNEIARLVIETSYKTETGERIELYQMAAFRGNADKVVRNFKKGAWVSVCGKLKGEKRDSYYNVSLIVKSVVIYDKETSYDIIRLDLPDSYSY